MNKTVDMDQLPINEIHCLDITISNVNIMGNCNILKTSNSRIMGNFNIIIGDNNIIVGSGNRIFGNYNTCTTFHLFIQQFSIFNMYNKKNKNF